MGDYRYCIPTPGKLVPAGEYPITDIQNFAGMTLITFEVRPLEEVSLPIDRIQFMS